ncbi:hypothetical protein ACFYMW_03085 [Streptomyces sp. NPDC006692]|uniref:hypothetical protein n=1 Tax=Streptomyces sp. NPDC006692 TaxID=3364758 RepID=UPI0036AF7C6A
MPTRTTAGLCHPAFGLCLGRRLVVTAESAGTLLRGLALVVVLGSVRLPPLAEASDAGWAASLRVLLPGLRAFAARAVGSSRGGGGDMEQSGGTAAAPRGPRERAALIQ